MNEILDDIREDSGSDEIKDWRNYLGKEANYYIPKWEKIQSGQKISFNIYAFLFGLFWMLYRKMYRTALIIGGILVFQIAIEELLRINMNITEEDFQPISWSITLLTSAFFALSGNWLFFNEAQRKIEAIKNSTIGDYDLKLIEAGGTSIASIFVGTIIYIVAIALAMIIIEPTIFY